MRIKTHRRVSSVVVVVTTLLVQEFFGGGGYVVAHTSNPTPKDKPASSITPPANTDELLAKGLAELNAVAQARSGGEAMPK